MRLVLFLIICVLVSVKSFRNNPIWLLLFLVFIYFLNPEIYIWGISDFRIVYILNITLIACVFYHYKRIDVLEDQYSILIALLLASFWISAFMAQIDNELAFVYTGIFLKLYIFWLMLKNILKHDIENIELFYWCCLISITMLSLWGVQQYLLGNIRLENFGGGQIAGSNQIAAAFIWALPIAYYKIISETKTKKIISIVCLTILLAGIVCTQSRQAFVALIFYVIYIVIKSRNRIKLLLIGFVFVFVALPFVPLDYFNRMETISNYEEDTSATGRIDMWKVAFRAFQGHPIVGVGGRNFYLIADRYAYHGERVRVTHNTYLQILSEEGLIGISIFLVTMFVTIFNLGKISRRFLPPSANDRVYYLSMTAQLSLIGVLICCIFQNKAEHEYLYWSSAVAAALTSLSAKISAAYESV